MIDQVRSSFARRDYRRTYRALREEIDATEAEVRSALIGFDDLWDELFPVEQARIVHLLVERIDVSPDGADIRLRTEGLTSLFDDLCVPIIGGLPDAIRGAAF